MDTQASLILDIGRSFARIGYAGDERPRIEAESEYAASTESINIETDNSPRYLFGDQLHAYNAGYRYDSLVQGSHVNEKIFAGLFSNNLLAQLNLDSRSMPVLWSEDNQATKSERLGLIGMFLEGNLAPAFMMLRQSVLSLYSCGKTSATVINSGSYATTVSTIDEGFFVQEGFGKVNFGGEHLTDSIAQLFSSDYFNILPDELHGESKDLNLLDDSFFRFERRVFARRLKHAMLGCEGQKASKYTLPDGETVFEMPDEISVFAQSMFNENARTQTNAVQDVLLQSIQRVVDSKLETKMFNSFILTGGNSNVDGYIDSMKQAVLEVGEASKLNPRLFVFPNGDIRSLSSWIGGSIFASIDNYQQFYITKAEFEEFGESVVDRKLL